MEKKQLDFLHCPTGGLGDSRSFQKFGRILVRDLKLKLYLRKERRVWVQAPLENVQFQAGFFGRAFLSHFIGGKNVLPVSNVEFHP